MIQNPHLNPDLLLFPNLAAALNFQKECPMCKSKLEINDRDLATDMGYEYRGEKKGTLSFFIDQREQEIITIDPYTGDVDLTIAGRPEEEYYTVGTTGSIGLTKTTQTRQFRNGRFMHALSVDCKQCSQYGYVLQVHVDMGERKVAGLYLNSEWMAVERDEVMYEIKNNYAMQKTYYSFYSNGKDQHAEIPLIPLNVQNPFETVDRAKKLLIFS
jgi:hypothetical protein